MFSDRLLLEFNRCPADCSACEPACSQVKEGAPALINSVHIPEAGFHGVITCRQCNEPLCLDVCPTGAIYKDEANAVVLIDEKKCVGCGLCTLSCPYGGIRYWKDRERSIKCDLCGGEPQCVEACRYGNLTFSHSKALSGYFEMPDLLSPGVPYCAGCTVETAARVIFRTIGNKDVVYFSTPGCNAPAVNGAAWYGGGTMSTLAANLIACMMTNVTSCMTGVSRYYQKIGKNVKCVCLVGDGTTADVGFQPLSGAAERGENILYICYDNEGYMNTGIQRSSTTPARSWTSTTWVTDQSRGKLQEAKNIPLIMLMHHVPYVATATIAYLEDFIRKLEKAKSISGFSYIHLLAPCPTGWRAPTDMGIQLSRLAVQTNYFPLWEAENGKLRLTYEIENPRPIKEFTRLMGRFSHLSEQDLEEFQRMVDERYAELKNLSLSRSVEISP
jgi:phenylglyoxylate dehydrogenase beta subunit